MTGTFVNVGAILLGTLVGELVGGRLHPGAADPDPARPRPRRAGHRRRQRAGLARHQRALRPRRRAARRPRRRGPAHRGPPRRPSATALSRRSPTATAHSTVSEGVLHRQPRLLRRRAHRRRLDPGRPDRQLRHALHQGPARRLRLGRAGRQPRLGRRVSRRSPSWSTRARSRSAPGLFDTILTDGSDALLSMTSAGGILIIGLALKLLDIQDVKVGNFLPALIFAPAHRGHRLDLLNAARPAARRR